MLGLIDPEPTSCSRCGAQFEPDTKFCSACGQAAPSPKASASPPPAVHPEQTSNAPHGTQPTRRRAWRSRRNLVIAGPIILLIGLGALLVSGPLGGARDETATRAPTADKGITARVPAASTDSTQLQRRLRQRGRTLFTDGNGTSTACSACHTLADASATATTGPDLDKALTNSEDRSVLLVSIVAPDALITPGFQGGIMPSNYGDTLSGAELDALVAYLRHATAGSPAGPGAHVLQMAADPNGQLAYATRRATAVAGRLTIVSENTSSVPHGIAIEGRAISREGPVRTHGYSSLTVTLLPGTYTYFCPVPGHREGGMEGTLTVR